MKQIDTQPVISGIFLIRLLVFTIGISFFLLQVGFAQTMKVHGRIDTESGDPLSEVWVGVHGKAPIVQTSDKGTYQLEVERGAVLEFTHDGYQTYRTVVWDSPEINRVLLSELPLELIETGYHVQPTREISSAISQAAIVAIQDLPTRELSQQLAGSASGLWGQGSGAPGMSASIRIRGIQSFLSTDPLVVVDGMPLPSFDLSFLDPANIRSVQVLKDAAATAIYGARGANGVLLIQTQKGEGETFRVLYTGEAGSQTSIGGYDEFLFQDPMKYADALWQRYDAASLTPPSRIFGTGATPVMPEYLYPLNATSPVDESTYSFPDNIIVRPAEEGTNWWAAAFEPAMITTHNLQLSGGSEPASYMLAAGYYKRNGVMKHTDFDRYNLRANSQFRMGKLTLGENLVLARTSGVSEPEPAGGGQNVMSQVLRMSPVMPVYDIGGNFAGTLAGGLESVSNPVAALERNKDNRQQSWHLLGNVYARYDLTKHLAARTSFGLHYVQGRALRFTFPNLEDLEPSTINRLQESWTTQTSGTWTNTLTWHKEFKNYTLNLTAGYENQFNTTRAIRGSMEGFLSTRPNAWYLSPALADAESQLVSSSGFKSRLASMFGRFDYTYKNKYLLTASVREDASSLFADGLKGTFYGTSVGWRISEEKFMDGMDWVEEWKVRAGFGIVGNMPVANNLAAHFGGGLASTHYDLNGTNQSLQPGFSVIQAANPLTQWEETQTMNIGTDLVLYRGKFSASFDYFEHENNGLLFQAPLPGTAGAALPPYSHTGAMINKGFEIFASWKSAPDRNWRMQISANISRVQNEIVRLDGQQDVVFGTGFESYIGDLQVNRVGYPVSSFYGYVADGIFLSTAEVSVHAEQEGAAPGRIRFKDLNQDGIIDELDKGPIGSALPDWQGGIGLILTHRRIDCSVSLLGSLGNEIFHYNKLFSDLGYQNGNLSEQALQHAWEGGSQFAQVPRLDASDTYSRQPSTWYVEDASFLRVRNVQIGYRLPGIWVKPLGFEKVRLYVQGHNLATLTQYSGVDPAAAFSNLPNRTNRNNWAGYDMGNYPHARMYLGGLELDF